MFFKLLFPFLALNACQCQIIYSRVAPYVLQKRPIRRSAIETLEKLQRPAPEYQMSELQVGVPTYQMMNPGYQTNAAEDPTWRENFLQPMYTNDDGDYETYEYETDFLPIERDADEAYVEPDARPSSNIYNDLLVNYLRYPVSDMIGSNIEKESQQLQRRSAAHIPQNSTEVSSTPLTFETPSKQVLITAVPPAPEKKEIKSMVIPSLTVDRDSAAGQKEEPLFRPLQNSQRTTWNIKDRRQNNSTFLGKKIIERSQQKNSSEDPLTRELQNLKKNPNL